MSDASVTSLISLLAIASVEFLVMGILVYGLLGIFKRITPKWRRGIWLLVMCKPLVTLLTGSFGGVLSIPLPVSGTFVSNIMLPLPAAQAALGADVDEAHVLLHVAAYVWLGVAVVLLTRVWLSAVTSRQLIDECLVKGYPLKPSTLRRLDPDIELPAHVRVIATPEDAGPAALGVFHPAVIIPESLLLWVVQHRDPTPQERARFCQVLRHEMAHVVNHDTAISIAAAIMRSIFWFHPTAYVAYRRIRMNNELCCDQHVVNSGVAPKEYVDTLLNVVVGRFSRQVFDQSILGDVTPMGVLRYRVNRLMSSQFGSAPRRQAWAYVTVAVLVLGMPRFVSTAPAGFVDIEMTETGAVVRVAIADLESYRGRAIVLTKGVTMPGSPLAETMIADGLGEREPSTGASATPPATQFVELPDETDPSILLDPQLDPVAKEATTTASIEELADNEKPEDLPEKKKPKRPTAHGGVDVPLGGPDRPILPLNKD